MILSASFLKTVSPIIFKFDSFERHNNEINIIMCYELQSVINIKVITSISIILLLYHIGHITVSLIDVFIHPVAVLVIINIFSTFPLIYNIFSVILSQPIYINISFPGQIFSILLDFGLLIYVCYSFDEKYNKILYASIAIIVIFVKIYMAYIISETWISEPESLPIKPDDNPPDYVVIG